MQDDEYAEVIDETLADKIIEATKESPKPGRDYGRGRPREGMGAPQKAVILKRLELNNWNYEKDREGDGDDEEGVKVPCRQKTVGARTMTLGFLPRKRAT